MAGNTRNLYLGAVGVGTTPPYQSVQAVAIVDSNGSQIDNFSGGGSSGIVTTSVPVRTPTTVSIASTTASATLLAANASRKGFSVSNVSTSKLYLSFTTPATSINSFIELPSGAFILYDQQLIVGNAIYGIWSSSNGTAQVTEYV